jgi:hypothetical protein
VIANSDTLQLMEKSPDSAPDFIVRPDLRSGWVMPGAVSKGLWPQP